MNKNESKYFNTARKMQEALIRLVDRKDFEFISVKEICVEAGVNRSTFYLHYDNPNDLLTETMEEVYKDFLARFEEAGKGISSPDLESAGQAELFLMTPQYLDPYLDFVKENRKLFKIMNHKSGLVGTEKTYARWFTEIFAPILSRFGVPEFEQPYIMTFYLKGLIGVIEEWVDHDCDLSNADVMEILKKCIMTPPSMNV